MLAASFTLLWHLSCQNGTLWIQKPFERALESGKRDGGDWLVRGCRNGRTRCGIRVGELLVVERREEGHKGLGAGGSPAGRARQARQVSGQHALQTGAPGPTLLTPFLLFMPDWASWARESWWLRLQSGGLLPQGVLSGPQGEARSEAGLPS